MKPEEFILQSLKELNSKKNILIPKTQEELVDCILKLLLNKKFRKYSAKPELVEHIKNAIKISIERKQPINLVFTHGAYKLWRLQEAPFPDWAELFAAMYYTKWLKPICEVYAPGVRFEYLVDDLILPKIDNISLEDVELYIKEYQKILDFLKQYQPENFKMEITRFKSQFSSEEVFEQALQKNIETLSLTHPTFTDEQLQTVELNARPTPEQLKDPEWREKIRLIHDAYINLKREIGYYFLPSKIAIFSQQLGSGMFLAVGTTKNSVVKFWVGAGALERKGESFIEHIFSPKHLELSRYTKEEIHIPGLESKNFNKIRVF